MIKILHQMHSIAYNSSKKKTDWDALIMNWDINCLWLIIYESPRILKHIGDKHAQPKKKITLPLLYIGDIHISLLHPVKKLPQQAEKTQARKKQYRVSMKRGKLPLIQQRIQNPHIAKIDRHCTPHRNKTRYMLVPSKCLYTTSPNQGVYHHIIALSNMFIN